MRMFTRIIKELLELKWLKCVTLKLMKNIYESSNSGRFKNGNLNNAKCIPNY